MQPITATARTRTMTEVTLVRAEMRTAYRMLDAKTGERLPDDTRPDVDVTTLQALHVAAVGRGERSDAWMVLDSTGAVVGALVRWEGKDGGWSAYRVRNPRAELEPAWAERMSPAQRERSTHERALDLDTLAWVTGAHGGALLGSGTSVFGERSRERAAMRMGWALA